MPHLHHSLGKVPAPRALVGRQRAEVGVAADSPARLSLRRAAGGLAGAGGPAAPARSALMKARQIALNLVMLSLVSQKVQRSLEMASLLFVETLIRRMPERRSMVMVIPAPAGGTWWSMHKVE